MAKTKNTERKKKKPTNKNGKIKKRGYQNILTYKCRYDGCKKSFGNSSNRISHENQHKGESYPCPLCPYVGKTKKYLSRHRKQVHTVPTKHKCKVCGKAFHHACDLKEHTMVHTGEKPYKCEICDKTFRVSYSLNCHILIHTDKRPHKCKFCEYACRDSSTLRKHEHRHLGLVKHYPCKICPRKFTEKAKLKYHISDAHLEVNLNKYACPQCDKAFKLKHLLKSHVEKVHDRTESCSCPVCGRELANKWYLPRHMRTHFSERPFQCTYQGCSAAFKDVNSLKKHTVIHFPRLHHACKICNKTFARKHRRDSHMATHQERKKRVECDYCGVKFYSKNYLVKHIKQKHNKKRPKYICDDCDFVAYNKPGLIMHMKYGHRIVKVLKCKICKEKKIYKRLEYLKSHYLHTHNVRFMSCPELKKRKKKHLRVEVKVEPIEEDTPDEDIPLLEIVKREKDEEEPTEDDYLTYSKLVLSEDLAQYMLDETAPENNFDTFLRTHVYRERSKHDDDPRPLYINKKQLTEVTQKIKDLLKRTMEEEEMRKAEERKKRDERMKRKRKRQEIRELRKVREFYNKRMKAAAEGSKKEPAKKITYFKNKVGECNPKKEENIIRHRERIVFKNEDWIKDANNDDDDDDMSEDTKPDIDLNDVSIKNDPPNDFTYENASANVLTDEIASTTDILDENTTTNDVLTDEIASQNNKLSDKIATNNLVNDLINNENDSQDSKLSEEATNESQVNILASENTNKNDPQNDNSSESTLTDDKDIENIANNNNGDKTDDDSHNDEMIDSNDRGHHVLRSGKNCKNKTSGKMNFKTHQCYICFKLYATKSDLNSHLKTHVGSEETTKYINHAASRQIDKKNRELKDKVIAKTKLVKKGKEWIVEKHPITVSFEELPEFTSKELRKLPVTGNYVERLGQLNHLAKKKGVKMLFPCDQCEKICQNFSAIKLHSRRHDPNKKPFAPRRRRDNEIKKKKEVNYNHRLAKPKPIVNKHKCDDELKQFYETHIRGADIEFWQFLKIYNKMTRENITSFKDFEGRTDFGIHNNDETNCDFQPTQENTTQIPISNLAAINTNGFAGRKKLSAKVRKPYKRVVLISRKLFLEREAAKVRMREKIAKIN